MVSRGRVWAGATPLKRPKDPEWSRDLQENRSPQSYLFPEELPSKPHGLVPRVKPVPWEGRELERAETHDAPKGFSTPWSHGPWTWGAV